MKYNYSFAGDISALTIAFMLLMLLYTTYVPKSKRLTFIKLSLWNLIFSCIMSLVFNTICVPQINKINSNIIYIVHNSLYISLIVELVIFTFYIFDLINCKKKWLYIMNYVQ